MPDYVTHALSLLALTIVTLLPIMNPLATCPLLLSLTPGWDRAARLKLVRKVCLYSLGILGIFLIAGERIIHWFSISVDGIRIAGGLIICRVGFDMLAPGDHHEAEREQLAQSSRDIAFTPLAMPTLAGPGSISVVLSMVSSSPANTGLINLAIIALGILLTVLISYIVLTAATSYIHLISQAALDAFTRIMGFLLICIAVQFVLSGVAGFIRTTNFG